MLLQIQHVSYSLHVRNMLSTENLPGFLQKSDRSAQDKSRVKFSGLLQHKCSEAPDRTKTSEEIVSGKSTKTGRHTHTHTQRQE